MKAIKEAVVKCPFLFFYYFRLWTANQKIFSSCYILGGKRKEKKKTEKIEKMYYMMDACVKLYSESSLWLKHKSKEAANCFANTQFLKLKKLYFFKWSERVLLKYLLNWFSKGKILLYNFSPWLLRLSLSIFITYWTNCYLGDYWVLHNAVLCCPKSFFLNFLNQFLQ